MRVMPEAYPEVGSVIGPTATVAQVVVDVASTSRPGEYR